MSGFSFDYDGLSKVGIWMTMRTLDSMGRIGLATLVVGFDCANSERGVLNVPYLLASLCRAVDGERPVDGGGRRNDASDGWTSSSSAWNVDL
jgi:hypothetical protein